MPIARKCSLVIQRQLAQGTFLLVESGRSTAPVPFPGSVPRIGLLLTAAAAITPGNDLTRLRKRSSVSFRRVQNMQCGEKRSGFT